MKFIGKITVLAMAALFTTSCMKVVPKAVNKKKERQFLALEKPIPKTNNILLVTGYFPSIELQKKEKWYQATQSRTYTLPSLDMAGISAKQMMSYLNNQGYKHVKGYALSPDSVLSNSDILTTDGDNIVDQPNITDIPSHLTVSAELAVKSLLNTYPHTDTVILVKSKFDFELEQVPTTIFTCNKDSTDIRMDFTVIIIDAKTLDVLGWKHGKATGNTPNTSLCSDIYTLEDQQIIDFLKQNYLVSIAAHSVVTGELLYGNEDSTTNNPKNSK